MFNLYSVILLVLVNKALIKIYRIGKKFQKIAQNWHKMPYTYLKKDL